MRNKKYFTPIICCFCGLLIFGVILSTPIGAWYALPLIHWISGLDLFIAFLDLGIEIDDTIFYFLFAPSVIFVGISCFIIGMLASKKIFTKEKIIVVAIFILIFAPLSIYSKVLSARDNKIWAPYNGGLGRTEEMCAGLSILQKKRQASCYSDLSLTVLSSEICSKVLEFDKESCNRRLAEQENN